MYHFFDDFTVTKAMTLITEAQFETYYKDYSRYVHMICRQWLGNTESAEDGVVTIFMKKWINRNRFNPALGSFKTYLTKNTRNYCIERVRSTLNVPKPVDLDEISETLASDLDLEAVSNSTIRICLSKLLPEDRELVFLKLYEGMTWAELSSLTGETEAQLRYRCAKAQKQLVQCWGQISEEVSRA